MRVGANESSSMSGTFSGEERDVRMGRRSEDLLDGGKVHDEGLSGCVAVPLCMMPG